MTFIAYLFSKLRTEKDLVRYLKRPVSEELSTSNIVNGPAECLNLHTSTFIILLVTVMKIELKKVSLDDI